MNAKIKFYNYVRKFGFLTTEEGDDIYIPAQFVRCKHLVPGAEVRIVVQLNKSNRRDKWWLRDLVCAACANQRKKIREEVEADIKKLAPGTVKVTWRSRSHEVGSSVLFWMRHVDPAQRTPAILKETMEAEAARELLESTIKKITQQLPEVSSFVDATERHNKLMSELKSRLPPTKMVRRYATNPYSIYDGDSDISDDSWLERADGLQPKDMATQEEKVALEEYLSIYPNHMQLEQKLKDMRREWRVNILWGLGPRPGLEICPWIEGKELALDCTCPTASAVFNAAETFLNSVARTFQKRVSAS
ncbi:MAG: hypothetical protein ACOYUZ_01525 [Patescibacteria group bacterium]